ncbi:FAD-dependent oxidoreductase [Gordonibacter massiliensis (ex Traore et al. 2017)]|uniref:FAD-dependent oxidoreductase n=1 Tax=Gordonibacter massiliensis (ex Traore et al. 2017) TaxID=1841863 RepID=UPI001C8BD878|nr:FAD-dependent oxidoreductase [Gordonibacter massiliensis (ex Traore et al. 2017)]MBX9034536.1 FAD-binding protein [Gordonibacter massiliensis (ex Traore et al. 2017)]
MSENKFSLDRRQFLGFGAVAAGAAAFGLAGCSPKTSDAKAADSSSKGSTSSAGNPAASGELTWLGAEPAIADADVKETVEADVVVVGCGLAGVAAARAAGEEGAQVVVFEKAEGPQCRSGEFAVINGDLEARWGRDTFDADQIVDHHMDECSYKTKRSIMSKWARHGAEVFDWYIGAKEDLYICDTTRSEVPDEGAASYLIPIFQPLPEAYDWTKEEHPVYPTSVELLPSQAPVLEANMEKAVSESDVTPFYGYFVEKLIMEDGRCTGCYARNAKDGSYVKATAKKGVILATGDYASNTDILGYYCPEVVENGIQEMFPNVDVEGNPTNTGDGLKLGAWVDAAIQQHHAPMIHHMGGGADISGEGVMGIAGFLQLDKHGKRFMNEDVPGQQVENQIELLKDKTSYQIWDGAWKDELQYMPAGHGVACYYDESLPKNNETYRNYKSQAKLDAAVAEGRCFKADTLEELFDQIGDIDKEAALASVARYNELAHAGKDEDFGKVSSRLFALETPPYYAVAMEPALMLVCLGGLASDEDAHVYSNAGDVIPGLYAAGNIQGDRFAVQYPISLKGVSHSMALYYGYVAGKNAVQQV